MDVPKQYDIRTLGDFAKVPADRLDACLADFKSWLALRRHFDNVNASLEASGLPRAFGGVDRFTWNDDGVVGVRAINLTTANGMPFGSAAFDRPLTFSAQDGVGDLTVRLSAARSPDSEGGAAE